MNDDDNYKVGYKRPPRHTRFKKGKSGNPRGRPRRKETFDGIMHRVLSEKVTMTEGGKKRAIKKKEAYIRRMVDKALNGDIKAMKQIWAWKDTQWDQS